MSTNNGEPHVKMECADEGFIVRPFAPSGDEEDGKQDFVCLHCGWMQVSAEGGAAELCNLATWDDLSAYRRFAEKARSGGYDVPDLPARMAHREGALNGSVGCHDWAIGAGCEDGFLVFVDDRPLAYKPTPQEARRYALEVIVRLRLDGDYRLNDRPAGFVPPPLTSFFGGVGTEIRARARALHKVGDVSIFDAFAKAKQEVLVQEVKSARTVEDLKAVLLALLTESGPRG